ncbi:MAG: D-alanyl-D-alanine carboxypeptidase/D-alanyl-D-alanine-endopeptidase [Bdellovibrionota bacterium]
MRKFFLAIAAGGLLFSSPALAQNGKPRRPWCQTPPGTAPLEKRLEAILADANSLRGARTSIAFAIAPHGTPLFGKNADELLTPASVTKIVTGAAALSRLGQEYVFPTELYGNLSPDGSTIKGDLYIKGYGDPSLVTERLLILAQGLKNRGLRKVTGSLVADDSFFDDVRFSPDWDGAEEESDNSYVAATGALSANFNALTVVVRPGQQKGDPPLAFLEPLTSFAALVNKAVTGAPGSGNTLQASRVEQKEGRQVILSGRIAEGGPEKRLYKNVENPGLHVATLLLDFLRQAGVQVDGGVRTGQVPEGTPLFDKLSSKPLDLILRDINKFSNNFIAEQLVKTLGATDTVPPGTWQKGLHVMGRYLDSIGVPESGWKLHDGSGLSRKNRLSAGTLVRVLSAVFQDPRYRAEYEASLSLGGADGTVRRRFKNDALFRRVRAKTGHLAAVSALAGYLYPPPGAPPIAFAVIVNGFRGGFPAVEADVDSLVATVLDACTVPPSLTAPANPEAPSPY